MTLFFQNPRDGHPMRVTVRRGHSVVEACECDDTQSCTELECRAIVDARHLSDAVHHYANVYDAAYVLRTQHGCADLD